MCLGRGFPVSFTPLTKTLRQSAFVQLPDSKHRFIGVLGPHPTEFLSLRVFECV